MRDKHSFCNLQDEYDRKVDKIEEMLRVDRNRNQLPKFCVALKEAHYS